MDIPVSQVVPMTPVGHWQENISKCGVEQVAPFWHGLLKHSSMSIKQTIQICVCGYLRYNIHSSSFSFYNDDDDCDDVDVVGDDDAPAST